MYKVFLVDDEIVIRENIRNSFPWEGNGGSEFSLAGEAPDGEIALQMMQDVKPDILITDIRMPFMDGMQLCEAVSHTMPWVQIVILSGYDDFAYAQQAISLGVKEYLLKPVSAQELLEVLKRIASRICEDRRQQADGERRAQRGHDRRVGKQLLVPAQRKTAPVRAGFAVVEGIENQQKNRRIQKRHNQSDVRLSELFHQRMRTSFCGSSSLSMR